MVLCCSQNKTKKILKSPFYFEACSNDLLKWNMCTCNFKKNTNMDIKLSTLQSLNFLPGFCFGEKMKTFLFGIDPI